MRNSKNYEFAKLSEKEQRKILFFADAEAGLYDCNIHKVVPQYELAHLTLMKLLENHLVKKDAGPASVEGAILDVGAGTGQEAIPVLEHFREVNLVALDLSKPILDILAGKLSDEKDLQGRCSMVCADVMADDFRGEGLRRLLPFSGSEEANGFIATISAFALHHLSHAEKFEAFRRIHAALASDGIFLNLDLFSFQSERLARQALQFDLEWICSSFDENSTREAPESEVGDKWLDHYKNYNITEPFERPACSREHRDSLPGQEQMLMEAGFAEVACPFRFWQVGITWAIK